jgi:hypothetical protein
LNRIITILRALKRALVGARSRWRRTSEWYLSYPRIELAGITVASALRRRDSLPAPFMVVYKQKAFVDHFLPGMIATLRRAYRGVDYLGFTRDERPRENPEQSSAKLLRSVEGGRPGAIFAYDSPLSPAEILTLTGQGIRVASNTAGLASYGIGGSPSAEATLAGLRAYSAYFIGHRPHVEPLRALGVNAQHMPFCYDPRWFRPLKVPKRYDILFVGDVFQAMNAGRQELLREVARRFKVALLCYQPFEPGLISNLGTVRSPLKLNRLLNEARIVLGSDLIASVAGVVNESWVVQDIPDRYLIRARTYLTIGSGACYVIERHPEIMREFKDGEEVVMWDTYDELFDRLDHLLKHDEERDAVGEAGQARALGAYTVGHAVEAILSALDLLPG